MNQNKRTMKILHLRSSGGFYGAEAVIFNVARELDQMGCVNHICCINNLDNPSAELVEKAQGSGIAASSVDAVTLLDHETIHDIRETLSEGLFDILHCHDYKASIYGLLASRKMDIRRVVTNHLWDAVDWKLWVYQRLEGFSYNLFDRVVAVSEAVKRDIRPFILHRSKIEVIENGVDVSAFGGKVLSAERRAQTREAFGLRDDDVVVGIVGRLARQKGHEYLLRAVALLKEKREKRKEKREDVKILVVGDGKLELSLKALCTELGLDFQDYRDADPDVVLSSFAPVIFAGVQMDMPLIYQIMDFLVMPSLEEGLPMALLEAMASGVPVAATPVGQIPRIIEDGKTGFFIEPGDVKGLTDVLGKMIDGRMEKGEEERKEKRDHGKERKDERRETKDDAGLSSMLYSLSSLENITQNARKLVEEKYSSRAMAKKYLEIYEWLVE